MYLHGQAALTKTGVGPEPGRGHGPHDGGK